jgi:hypothetical protein
VIPKASGLSLPCRSVRSQTYIITLITPATFCHLRNSDRGKSLDKSLKILSLAAEDWGTVST